MDVISLKCPNCGASITTQSKKCEYCQSDVLVKSFKKYDEALAHFEKAQADNFDNAAPFFYAAVSRLKGRKPFLCSRAEINQMETDINAAMSIEPAAEQYYFLSYIGRDYFKRKFLNHQPSWESLMEEAVNNGLSPADVEEFHAMIGTPVDISLD